MTENADQIKRYRVEHNIIEGRYNDAQVQILMEWDDEIRYLGCNDATRVLDMWVTVAAIVMFMGGLVLVAL